MHLLLLQPLLELLLKQKIPLDIILRTNQLMEVLPSTPWLLDKANNANLDRPLKSTIPVHSLPTERYSILPSQEVIQLVSTSVK
jgi:hypothetical protein